MRLFTGFLPTVLLLLILAHSTEGLTVGHARIVLENHTGSYFKFQVLHQYTDRKVNEAGWREFAPGEAKEMFAGVRYPTGNLTTGVDNWIIHGIQLNEVKGSVDSSSIKFNGKNFFEGPQYISYSGDTANWKTHMLNEDDDGKTTYIKVYQSFIEFISPSGTSSTRFDTVIHGNGRYPNHVW